MEKSHFTTATLRRLLTLTEQKEQILSGLKAVEDEIYKTFGGVTSTAAAVVKNVIPAESVKPAKKAKKARGKKSGGLKGKILSLLGEAGSQGLHVKDIAGKLGAKASNISVWFSTTGKKLTTKIKPAHFVLKGSTPVAAKAAPAAVKAVIVTKPVASKKRKISAGARAKMAAAATARWAAVREAKGTATAVKKGFKRPKQKKGGK